MAESKTAQKLNIERAVEDILDTIERDREREIVSRRFGLFDRRETLEQIGELLGITRERVRQLEKVVVSRLKAGGEKLPHISEVQATSLQQLAGMGNAARISKLAKALVKDDS